MSGVLPPPSSARRRVLVAEDDPDIARLLQRVLGAHCDVFLASNGHEALGLATHKPHLLVLDIMMPGLDGLTVARQIRELPGMKAVPIIFLTAKDSPQDVIRGIQSGARHYITKPFKIDDLVAKVKKILKI